MQRRVFSQCEKSRIRVQRRRQLETHATSSPLVRSGGRGILCVFYLCLFASVLIAVRIHHSMIDPAARLGVGLDSPSLSERAGFLVARSSSLRSPRQRIKEGKNLSYSAEVRWGMARCYIPVSWPIW